MNIYQMVRKFKREYPKTVAFRTKAHSSVIERHLNPGEEVLYAFCAQKNTSSFMIINSCAVALTNKRILIGQKRLLWGYFFTTITPDMYNDLTIGKGIIWGRVVIDTIKEVITITNIDARALDEVETSITEIMIKAKKEYEEKKD